MSEAVSPRGLRELMSYPLITALRERRTRRVARGTSVLAGDLSYESDNEPDPLTPLEEAVLVVATGLTGLSVMHDVPTEKTEGEKEVGTPLVNVLARSASSPDNCQATSFFMINDEGTWLLRQLRGRRAAEFLAERPQRWEDWTTDDWIGAAAAVKHKVYDQRIDFPRRWPFYLGWNKQLSNVPGTTNFLPLVDCTRQTINVLLILLSEPEGERPLFVDDWQKFRPRTLADWGGWVASKLGLVPKISYQPIGGVRRAREGYVNPEHIVPLGMAQTLRTDYEAHFHLQNLMLVGHAMGLGGWIHAAVPAPFLFERHPDKGELGLVFRHHVPAINWRRLPPQPSPRPNPVGLDGVLEGLCPPYVDSMDEAVDRVLEEKFGEQGMYGDKELFARPYKSSSSVDAFLRSAKRHPDGAIDYVKEICNYVVDTYGRFPGHIDAFHSLGVWLQFSHIELEYYEEFFVSTLYRRQLEMEGAWRSP